MNAKQKFLGLKVHLLAWLAGFIDADGSINAQIVGRSDYKLKYQVRVSITGFQSTKRHHAILRLNKLFGTGTVRKRNDGMSEATVVGPPVEYILEGLLPYIWLKRGLANRVLKIARNLPKTRDPQGLVDTCRLVDKVGLLTDGKLRKITTLQVIETLRSLGYDVK
uniref:putative GIY-YIG homing endonuclease n=1 Tax=Calidiella yingdensis TaxID=3031288 RepID=UPI002410E6CB|nr:putative GIY-YIG homing endonuclease [Calidiella yingdensis]WDY13068.1 putative GIY-YIG homing endonuclease [Calidiella yingdensis]